MDCGVALSARSSLAMIKTCSSAKFNTVQPLLIILAKLQKTAEDYL